MGVCEEYPTGEGEGEGSISAVTCKKGSEEEVREILMGKVREMRMRVVKSASPLNFPHHIHYQPFLKALLAMSYIPAHPILKGGPRITARRLEQEDDDYLLISRMFLSRGGVVYIKKVSNWLVH